MKFSSYLTTIWMLAKTMTKRFFRDKVALFFTFVFPLIFLFVFGSIFNDSGQPTFRVALINNAESEFAEGFIEQGRQDGLFEITATDDFEAAQTRLGRGEFDVIMELPEQFGRLNDDNVPSGTIITYYDQADQQAAQTFNSVVQGILDEINRQLIDIEPPLGLRSETLQTANLSQFDYTFSGLIGFTILSMGIFGLANSFPADKKAGILRRLRSTPLTASQLIAATAAYYALVTLISVATMVVVGLLVFDFNMRGHYFDFGVFALIGTILMLGFGLAIGGWARNEYQAAPLSNLIAFPMMFLSGVFFPLFLMPQWLQDIAAYIPLTPVVEGMRLILTEGARIIELGPQLGIIGIWLVVIYTVTARFFRWE